ncbi:MAG: radical SAM protein [Anaerolineae bacterium]|nr:radical SAM protein [Anaerolineae bacterium]
MSRISKTEISGSPPLKIAASCIGVSTLGPGLRSVVWVQGCPFHCPGCIAPGWVPFDAPAAEISPQDLAQVLLTDLQVSGLTLSGGEPFAQAEGLAALVSYARQRRELDVICFSGYRFETLLNHPPSPGVFDLLDQIDLLIDGPYIESKNDGKGLRGSNNQRFIHLTNRLRGFDFENQPRRAEVSIQNGEVFVVGVPPKNVLRTLDQVAPGKIEILLSKGRAYERA